MEISRHPFGYRINIGDRRTHIAKNFSELVMAIEHYFRSDFGHKKEGVVISYDTRCPFCERIEIEAKKRRKTT